MGYAGVTNEPVTDVQEEEKEKLLQERKDAVLLQYALPRTFLRCCLLVADESFSCAHPASLVAAIIIRTKRQVKMGR